MGGLGFGIALGDVRAVRAFRDGKKRRGESYTSDSTMFFVPVSWPDYEFACLTPSGQAAVGVTVSKKVRLLARQSDGQPWRVMHEWAIDRLSHTEIMIHLGGYSEPGSPDDILTLVMALEASLRKPTADS